MTRPATGCHTNLLLRAVGVDHVHVDAFVDQFVEKLSSSIDGLDEDQHRGQEALKSTEERSQCESSIPDR